jgi:hypothetical protein
LLLYYCCDILRSFGYTFRPNRVGGIDPRHLQLSHLCICTSVSYSRRIQETNSATGHSFPRNQSSTPSTLSFWLIIQVLDLGGRIILHLSTGRFSSHTWSGIAQHSERPARSTTMMSTADRSVDLLNSESYLEALPSNHLTDIREVSSRVTRSHRPIHSHFSSRCQHGDSSVSDEQADPPVGQPDYRSDHRARSSGRNPS